MNRFKEKLEEQVRFLRRSCSAYDEGDHSEFVRIATSICIITDDGGRNTQSLLSHLGFAKIQMLSTSTNPRNLGKDSPWGNLTNLEIISMVGGRFVPIGQGKVRCMIGLEDWWRNEGVFVRNGERICRRDVVRWARDKDGGAHVDSSLPQRYREILEEGAGWSMTVNPDNGVSRTVVFTGAPQATVRQIASELLESLKQSGITREAIG